MSSLSLVMSSTENVFSYEEHSVATEYDEGNLTMFNLTEINENLTLFNSSEIYEYPDEELYLYFDKNFTLEDAIAEYHSNEFSKELLPYTVFFVISLLGIVFNLLNVVIYSRKSMISSINLLLLAFEAANIIFFSTFIAQGVEYYNPNKVVYTFPWAIYRLANPYVRLTISCLSNWLAVTVGIWRCIALGMTLKAKILLSKTRAKLVITFLIVVSPLLAIPSLLLATYKEQTVGFYNDPNAPPLKNFTLYLIEAESMREHIFYYFNWLCLIVIFCPCPILLAATSFLIYSLRRASKMRKILMATKETSVQVRDRKMTYMLLVVLVTFLLSYFPDAICVCVLIHNYDNFINGTTTWSRDGVCKTMIMGGLYPLLSNCATFFIYYFMSENFRQTLHDLFIEINLRRKSIISRMLSIFPTIVGKTTDQSENNRNTFPLNTLK